MRFLSVCSGIEAASVAWGPLGWEAVAFAEIEKFPCAVLAHHYPDVPNWGDITRFREWPDASFDVLAGGTPCQSFSIAGLRAGLADPRGNLALTYLAIADRYRPEWVVWENVPGVRSVDEGRAFGAFLGGLGELGYGWAYRSLDAQYFGLAQRRERVFVVGHLGDWRRAAAVLFEPDCMQGNPAPRRETGERPAPTIASRPTGGGGLGTDFDCDGGLVTHALRADGFDASEDGTGRGTPLLPTLVSNGDAHSGFRDEHGLVTLRRVSVRRLTPRECERLQGFPDNYTQVPYRGKPASDGPRYKALGNSMAVPVIRWIGQRIALVQSLSKRAAA
jgi:DNA (cytosine-5)-methyltransferase 1